MAFGAELVEHIQAVLPDFGIEPGMIEGFAEVGDAARLVLVLLQRVV